MCTFIINIRNVKNTAFNPVRSFAFLEYKELNGLNKSTNFEYYNYFTPNYIMYGVRSTPFVLYDIAKDQDLAKIVHKFFLKIEIIYQS